MRPSRPGNERSAIPPRLRRADDPARRDVRLACAEALLAWRAEHLDRTLTHIELTDRGPITG